MFPPPFAFFVPRSSSSALRLLLLLLVLLFSTAFFFLLSFFGSFLATAECGFGINDRRLIALLLVAVTLVRFVGLLGGLLVLLLLARDLVVLLRLDEAVGLLASADDSRFAADADVVLLLSVDNAEDECFSFRLTLLFLFLVILPLLRTSELSSNAGTVEVDEARDFFEVQNLKRNRELVVDGGGE
jgi:hypothetical protein